MAIISNIKCEQCGLYADIMHSPIDARPKICPKCYIENLDLKREQHFTTLSALSIEERLRRIEEWIYDYKPRVPLSEIRF